MSSPFQQKFMAKKPFKASKSSDEDFYKDIDPYEAEGNRMEAAEQEKKSKVLPIDDKTSYDYDYDQNPETTGSPAKMGGYEGGGVPANGGYVSNKQDYQRMFNKIEAGTKEFMYGQKKEKDYQRDLKEKERQMKLKAGPTEERDGPPQDACGSLFTGPCPKPGDTETDDSGSSSTGTGGSGGSGGSGGVS